MEVILTGGLKPVEGRENAYVWSGKWFFKGNRSKRSEFSYSVAFNGPVLDSSAPTPRPDANSTMDWYGPMTNDTPEPTPRGSAHGAAEAEGFSAMDVDAFPGPPAAEASGASEEGAGMEVDPPERPGEGPASREDPVPAEQREASAPNPAGGPSSAQGQAAAAAAAADQAVPQSEAGEEQGAPREKQQQEGGVDGAVFAPPPMTITLPTPEPPGFLASGAACEGSFNVHSTVPVTKIAEQFVLTLGERQEGADMLSVVGEGTNVYGPFELVGNLSLSKMWLVCTRTYKIDNTSLAQSRPRRRPAARQHGHGRSSQPLERRASQRSNLGMRRTPLWPDEWEGSYTGASVCDDGAVGRMVDVLEGALLRWALEKWADGLPGSGSGGGGGGGGASSSTSGRKGTSQRRPRALSEGAVKGRSSSGGGGGGSRSHSRQRSRKGAITGWTSAFVDVEGGVFEGELLSGEKHGVGLCVFQNGFMFQGLWRHGREHGAGKLLTSDRRVVYEGDWAEGKMNGKGRYVFPSGAVYEGEWRENMRWGKGVYTAPEGHVYDGEWRDDVRWGYGVYTWASGSVYEGEWARGLRNGRGTLRCLDGLVYSGQWVDNRMEGKGTCTYPDGSSYEGMWRNGKREGRGTLSWPNGASYEGRFRDDQIDGQGTLEIPRPVPGAFEGEWIIPLEHKIDVARAHHRAGFGAGGM